MISKQHTIGAAIALMAFGATPFFASAEEDDHEHEGEMFDIAVWNDNGTLRTGGWDHDEESLEVQYLRVFEAHLGEDEENPYGSAEPGVGGVAADLGLMEGTTFSLNISSGLGMWNGEFFEYGQANMSIEYGLDTVDTLSGGSLDFLVTEDFDVHPFFTIDSDAGSGAYLLELTASMDGYATSDPFYILFNNGEYDVEEFEEAHTYVEDVLVPAPGVLALLGLFGATARRRRQG
ncbi:MAG: hypothetical protein VX641_07285 [Planctomycetota bacterium]|nr:hypothetical protein [Planctomycetota bacterium]